MSKPVVAVTRRIPSAGLALLTDEFDVRVHDSEVPPTPARLQELLSDAEAALVLLSDTIDDALLDHCPQLRIIANMAVGYDNIDVDAATKRGVWISNTPGVLTESTADLAFGLILAVCRRIIEADAFMRRGEYRQWDPRLLRGFELKGATLGIFGLGRIGTAVARRATAFGMDIIYTSRSAHPNTEAELGAERVSFEQLLQRSDVLSLHASFAENLRHRFTMHEFSAMKSGAFFINTARGPLMNEADLLKALVQGEIAGAGLDVYENEPDYTSGLEALDNVVMLPHIGSATTTTRNAMATMAARNIVAVLAGGKPETPLNQLKE